MYSCKKFLSVAKMAKTVYEREMCRAGQSLYRSHVISALVLHTPQNESRIDKLK